jgi:hypothetical protein
MNPVVDEHGTQRWYENGKLHRINGAAVIYANGDQFWYKDGKLHRTNGPAAIYASGTKKWYLDDTFYSFTQWLELTPLDNNAKLLLQIQWSDHESSS